MRSFFRYFNFLISLPNVYKISTNLEPWCWFGFWLFSLTGFILGLFIVPSDIFQGDAFRIIYIHVPAALLSLLIYVIMSVCALLYLIFKIKVYDLWAQASAPIGAAFTLIALITGAIWGKPMWGTWWAWDARLTSELILLFIYIGIICLQNNNHKSWLILIGLIDIPIIHFSVIWWQTLHQGPSISSLSKLKSPSIDLELLWPIILVYFGLLFYYFAISLSRLRFYICLKKS